VLIAIPNCQGRVSPVFDTACRLLVVRWERGREVKCKEFLLGVLEAEALARSVTELRVDVLLCAAISAPLQLALERDGVRVEDHLCGEVEALLAAYCAGSWRHPEFKMPGCWEEHGRSAPARRGRSARAAHPNRIGGIR
jgi:predicted Fe-Mo cluster-binding NifX family protein